MYAAGTYAFASYLPIPVLDILLNIPHFLMGIRNALLPVPPRVPITPAAPELAVARSNQTPTKHVRQTSGTSSDQDHSHLSGSEADVESNTEHDHESGMGDSVMGESWVSLHGQASQ